VASRVGVSTASVSLVLRNVEGPSAETRRRVLQAAAELNYRPDRAASLLARSRSNVLGVMIDVRSTYHAELVEHLHSAAERAGYDLVLSTVTPRRDSKHAIETLVDSRCAAVLLLGPDAPTAHLNALGEQIAVVVVGRRLRSATIDVVRSADDRGVAQAVRHLADLGHREIAYVDGGPGTIASDRRRGYRRAMKQLGLGDRCLVVSRRPHRDRGTSGRPRARR
jgi:DNA-binding LacI/PurR family transcriptional regulator